MNWHVGGHGVCLPVLRAGLQSEASPADGVPIHAGNSVAWQALCGQEKEATEPRRATLGDVPRCCRALLTPGSRVSPVHVTSWERQLSDTAGMGNRSWLTGWGGHEGAVGTRRLLS